MGVILDPEAMIMKESWDYGLLLFFYMHQNAVVDLTDPDADIEETKITTPHKKGCEGSVY